MVKIDESRCVGCGRCVSDCLPQALQLSGKKARFLPDHNCMQCGHCIAVCPKAAVSIPSLNMQEVMPLRELPHTLDAQTFLGYIRSRRTIRAFDGAPLQEDEVEKLLDAGRFSPTGGNRQDVAYNVLRTGVPQFREMILAELEAMYQEDPDSSWYPALWHQMYLDAAAGGKDRLFFGAGTVIVVSSDSPQAACIASAHMEIMANAMGFGVLYSGFTVRALAHSEELQRFLQLRDGYAAWAALVVGRARISYLRTVPRKKADVIWN